MTNRIENAPKEEVCQECRYFLHYGVDDDDDQEEVDPDSPDYAEYTGVCRRYPPRLYLIYPESISQYPDVAGATGWCGEFTPKL